MRISEEVKETLGLLQVICGSLSSTMRLLQRKPLFASLAKMASF